MAVVRAKTSSNYGIIIFLVFLIVIAGGLAVFFYTQNAKLELAAVRAEKNLAKLGLPRDVDEFLKPERFPPNQTKKPLREAMDEIDAIRTRLAVGDPAGSLDVPASVVPDAIDSKLNTLGLLKDSSDRDRTIFKTLENLALQRDQNESRAKAAESKLLEAQTTITNNLDNYKADRDAWQKSLAELQKNKDQLTAQVQQEEKAHKDDITKYEAEIDKDHKERADEQRQAAIKLKQKEDEIATIQNEIGRLRMILAQFKPKNPVDMSNEPDGRIARVEANSDVVYVNIGSAERATRGLTFAVYDPKFNMNAGDQGHEKAFIELVEVGEHESLARITHGDKSQQVVVGDIIANPIFHADRARKFHFYVYGDFDMDGDGVPTPAEREQLVRLIQNWGGVIDDQFTTQTDFLVLGAPPGSSTHVFDTGTDADKARDQQRAGEQKLYTELTAKAHDWSIPVLNANRFLTMIGYYNTSTVERPLYRAPK